MPIKPEATMEQLSRAFLKALASNEGFTCEDHHEDYGVDCSVHEASSKIREGRNRYFLTGRTLQVQLKSTTERGVRFRDSSLVYDLEGKTFNDLLERRQANRITPLVLGLLVLPDERAEWAVVAHHQLEVRHSFYFWQPDPASSRTQQTSIAVEIPLANQVFMGALTHTFEGLVP